MKYRINIEETRNMYFVIDSDEELDELSFDDFGSYLTLCDNALIDYKSIRKTKEVKKIYTK